MVIYIYSSVRHDPLPNKDTLVSLNFGRLTDFILTFCIISSQVSSPSKSLKRSISRFPNFERMPKIDQPIFFEN